MITVRCDDHRLAIFIKVHLETAQVKNHLKISSFLNIGKLNSRIHELKPKRNQRQHQLRLEVNIYFNFMEIWFGWEWIFPGPELASPNQSSILGPPPQQSVRKEYEPWPTLTLSIEMNVFGWKSRDLELKQETGGCARGYGRKGTQDWLGQQF